MRVEGDDGAVILGGVTTTVPDAGVTCLLGPSGAGKSTMLRLCNRLEVADAGEVRVRGTPVSELDPLELRRELGMVFQRPTLFPGTVRDNLAVAVPDAGEPAYRDALARAGLDPGFLDRAGDGLSGGEAQRVCVARTLLTEPAALLMDEPTSALDPAARAGIEQLARQVADGGVPIVWVTHDLEQAARIADHVVVVVAGELAAAGAPAEVRASDDPRVVAFLAGETQPEQEASG